MDEFGIKVTNAYKGRSYRPSDVVYKFDGEELNEWDIKFLYTRAEVLNFEQIADLFDTKSRLISEYAYMYGVKPRYQDKELRKNWWRQDREAEEREKERRNEEEINKRAAKLRKPERVKVNGKTYVNAEEWEEYQENLKTIRDWVELEAIREEIPTRKKDRIPMSTLKNYHLIALRAYRGLDRMAFSIKIKVPFKEIRRYELTKDEPIPLSVEKLYIDSLRISRKELQKIKDVMTGERDLAEEEDREIPIFVRIQVWERDKGKCTGCGRKKYLHYHHIKHFSKGGMHTQDNIKLLCVACHASEHRNDKAFYMLKKQAEELLGVIV